MTYTHHTKRPAARVLVPPPISEGAFQQRITDYCKMRGLTFFHDHESKRNNPGFPDLVIVGPEHVLWRELKTDIGRLRPEQEKWIVALRAAGQDAGVWRPKDWSETVLPQLRALTANLHLRGT